jgi:hypothetical protein
MFTMRDLVLLSITVFTTLVVRTQVLAQTCRGPAAHWSVGQSDATVSEMPRGVIDGTNVIFVTRRVPDERFPIEVFRNGVPLINGVDFENSANVVALSHTQIPVSGDSLRVKYVPGARTKGAASVYPGPAASAQVGDLSLAAAREALQSEAEKLGSVSNIVRASVSPVADRSVATSDVDDLLQTLSFRARGRAALRTERTYKAWEDTQVLQGIDGLGDGPEAEKQRSEYRGRGIAPETWQTQTDSVITTSPAVRMLDERLRSNASFGNTKPVN